MAAGTLARTWVAQTTPSPTAAFPRAWSRTGMGSLSVAKTEKFWRRLLRNRSPASGACVHCLAKPINPCLKDLVAGERRLKPWHPLRACFCGAMRARGTLRCTRRSAKGMRIRAERSSPVRMKPIVRSESLLRKGFVVSPTPMPTVALAALHNSVHNSGADEESAHEQAVPRA